MSLKKLAQLAAKEARRQERVHAQQQREAARAYQADHKELERLNKELQVAQAQQHVRSFEDYLATLGSLHKDGAMPFDWNRVASMPEPQRPGLHSANQSAAEHERDTYAPTFFDRLFGREKKKRQELEAAVGTAEMLDRQMNEKLQAEFASMHGDWRRAIETAHRISIRDPRAYGQVLVDVGAVADLEAFGVRAQVVECGADLVRVDAAFADSAVPAYTLTCTKTGKISQKVMAKKARYDLLQDFACSVVLRVARDAFAFLPIQRVIANVGEFRPSTVTGHNELQVYVGAHIRRDVFERLNIDAVDASDSMQNFDVRMSFKKTKGFEPVPAVTSSDQWVST